MFETIKNPATLTAAILVGIILLIISGHVVKGLVYYFKK